MFDTVTAVILAGGLGTRLRSIVTDRPKALANVHGRPFILYLLDQLDGAGIQDVVICTGHMGDQVQTAGGDCYSGLRLRYSHEPELLGTAGALRLALPLTRSDLMLVLNGDSFCQADLHTFMTWHSGHKGEASVLLAWSNHADRYGQVDVAADGSICRFMEKPGTHQPGWINAGIYLLTRHLIQTIPSTRVVSLEREVFPALVGRGLYGYRSHGRLVDIGTPEGYALAETFFTVEARV